MDHGFPFMQSGGFLGLPFSTNNDAKKRFAVVGICWDGCVTNRPGARFGPNAIRHASHMLCGDEHPYFETTPVNDTVDLGNLPLPNTSLEAMRAALMPQAAALIATKTMVWLGGDHSITLPLLRAYKKRIIKRRWR